MKLINIALSYIPTRLPLGMSEFNAWSDSIVELTGPIADADSLKWVIANEIMRLNPGRDKVAKRLFVKLLRKYAANQIAAGFVMELKQKQEQKKQQELEQQKAAEAAQVSPPPAPSATASAEDTAPTNEGAANEKGPSQA